MKYISSKELPTYRREHKPYSCDILSLNNYTEVVDHDHATGRIRGVISSEGNVLIGKIENCFRTRCSKCSVSLPEVLRKIANYLERPQGPLHPIGVRQLVKRFNRMNKKKQIEILMTNYDKYTISKCKNGADRAKLYRDSLIKE